MPLQTGYYDVYNRDNVELVDVSKAPIEAFTENGLKTAAAEHALDVIIMATGFDAGTGSLTKMNIHGRDGVSLTELWSKDIRSTMGLQVSGFTNLFTVAGPLAPSTAFCNMATCLPQQVDWISDAIVHLRDHKNSVIEPTVAKQDEWVRHHDETANATLLVRTKSWYTGTNIAGKPIRLLSYIGGVNTYKRLCEEVKASGYEVFAIVGPGGRVPRRPPPAVVATAVAAGASSPALPASARRSGLANAAPPNSCIPSAAFPTSGV